LVVAIPARHCSFDIHLFFCDNDRRLAVILSLLFQLFLTGRLLRRFGIGPALFVVPVALLAGSAGVLVSGTILAAVFLKGSDQILRYSIDKSTVELLYLPISPGVKVQIKSFIDTVIWRMGDGMAGVTLLGFATFLGLSPRSVSWVVLGLLLVWLTAALTAKREYVATLQESIHHRQLDSDRAAAPVMDKSTSELLAANLAEVVSTSPDGLLYALSLYEISPDREANPAVRDLLKHPDPTVRQKAMSVITATGDPDALQSAEELLHDSAIEVRTEALLYLSHHHPIDPITHIESLGDFPDFSIRSGMVAFLAQPGETQNLEAAQQLLANMVNEGSEGEQRNRLEAARLLGYLPDHFDQQFRQLMEDSDLAISRAAITSAGRLRTRRFVPRLLDLLTDPHRETAAAAALAKFGDGIVGTLRDHLTDPSTPKEIRRELPVVLAQIDSPRAVRILVENLLVGDPKLRYEIIAALNKIQQQHPNVPLRAPLIETGLAAEILCTYQFDQLLADLPGRQQQQETPGVSKLEKLREQGVERIFRLLGLLHPNRELKDAYLGIQSDSPGLRDKSLEFLDNILKPQIRSLLIPLLDSEVSSAERAQLAKKLISRKMEDYSCKDATTHLVNSDNSWLKTCGAFAVGVLGIKSLEPALDTCLNHPDPLLCATARKAKGLLKSVPQAATSFFA
jgi:HEAT repeat protein